MGTAIETIDLSLSNDYCFIQWECNLRDSIYAILVYPQHFERAYLLIYDLVNVTWSMEILLKCTMNKFHKSQCKMRAYVDYKEVK